MFEQDNTLAIILGSIGVFFLLLLIILFTLYSHSVQRNKRHLTKLAAAGAAISRSTSVNYPSQERLVLDVERNDDLTGASNDWGSVSSNDLTELEEGRMEHIANVMNKMTGVNSVYVSLGFSI